MAGRAGLEQTRRRRTAGLVSDRESGRRVAAARYDAPDDLGGVADRFWSGDWDLRGQLAHEVRLLADPLVHLVFEAGQSRVVGVCRGLWTRRLEDRGRVRGVALTPGGALRLGLGPARQWTDRLVPLAHVVPEAAALEASVLAAPTDEEGFVRVLGWMRSAARPLAAGETAEVLHEMRTDLSLQRVDHVAAHVGVSVRRLQRLFRDEVGASPKWVIQRFRLQEAVHRLEDPAACLATTAMELGFADQAHLTRVFRAAVGQPPGMYRRSR